MLKPIMHAIVALALIPCLALAGTSASFGAEKNMFKDLPGVVPPKGFSTQSAGGPEERPDCTSQLVSPYYNGRRQMPVRMYSCKNGLVTYESTTGPGLAPPAGDPYVHGENMQGFPGTPN